MLIVTTSIPNKGGGIYHGDGKWSIKSLFELHIKNE